MYLMASQPPPLTTLPPLLSLSQEVHDNLLISSTITMSFLLSRWQGRIFSFFLFYAYAEVQNMLNMYEILNMVEINWTELN